jgi:hypothetical protein
MINEYSVGAMHLFRAVVKNSWNSMVNSHEVIGVFCVMYDRHKVWQLTKELLTKPLGDYYFMLLLDVLYSPKTALHPGAINLCSRSVWSRDAIPRLASSRGIVLQALDQVSKSGGELVIKEVLTGVWHMLVTDSSQLTVEWHSIWAILEHAYAWRVKFQGLLREIWQKLKLRRADYQGGLAELEKLGSLYRLK